MIDLGIEKMMVISVVALIVIGPEKLPRVARTVGTLLGKAQRYVADVKAEVNRSIELEELRKMKGQFEDAARDVEQSVSKELHQTASDLNQGWADADPLARSNTIGQGSWSQVSPVYKHPKKNWRLKRGAMPHWYKQRHGIRGKAQSGAARVARFRPPRSSA